MKKKEYKDGIYPTSRFKIAVTGKGGVGKTIIVALMSRIFAETGKKILVVDADPAMGLAYVLGADTKKSIGGYRDRMLKEPELKKELAGMKIRDVLIREGLISLDGCDMLIMGKEESSECYCGVNSVLKYGVGSIAKNYDIMLIDCEAGLEQIHRRVVGSVDILFVVTDLSMRGIKTALQIKEVIDSGSALKECKASGLIINRASASDSGENIKFQDMVKEAGLEIFGLIPEDKNVRKLDMEGGLIGELSENSLSLIALKKDIKKRYEK